MSAWLGRRGSVCRVAQARGWTSEEMLAVVFFHSSLSAERQLLNVSDSCVSLRSRRKSPRHSSHSAAFVRTEAGTDFLI